MKPFRFNKIQNYFQGGRLDTDPISISIFIDENLRPFPQTLERGVLEVTAPGVNVTLLAVVCLTNAVDGVTTFVTKVLRAGVNDVPYCQIIKYINIPG
jgi:hypothetical protein